MSRTEPNDYTTATIATPRAVGVELESTESANAIDPPQQEEAHMKAKMSQRAVRRKPTDPLPVLDLVAVTSSSRDVY